MARDTSSGAEDVAGTDDLDDDVVTKHDTARKHRRVRALPMTLTVLGAAGIIAAGVLANKPGINYQNQAFVDRPATAEVATAAAASAQRIVAIDYRDLDGYHSRLADTLTPKVLEEFEPQWQTLKQTYTQGKTVIDAKVTDTGITFLEGDRAEALVSAHLTITQNGEAAGEATGTYILGMQQTDGVWKVSSIPDLPS